jgi:hypothetical protein
LPYLTETWAERLITQYKKVINEENITVEQAVKLLEESKSPEKRKLLETA